MKPRISLRWVGHAAAIVLGWTWLTALSCDAGPNTGPDEPAVGDCELILDSSFPSQHFDMSKPAKCPIKLRNQTGIPYSAHIQVPSGSVVWRDWSVSIENRLGNFAGHELEASWYDIDGQYDINVNGTAQIASGGFNTNNEGFDWIINTFTANPGGYPTSARSKLTYRYGDPSIRFVGPTHASAGETYDMLVWTDDWQFSGPLTWTWYLNGQYYASGVTEVTLGAGEPGSSQYLEVVASDNYGHTLRGGRTVIVPLGGGCPNGEIIC